MAIIDDERRQLEIATVEEVLRRRKDSNKGIEIDLLYTRKQSVLHQLLGPLLLGSDSDPGLLRCRFNKTP